MLNWVESVECKEGGHISSAVEYGLCAALELFSSIPPQNPPPMRHCILFTNSCPHMTKTVPYKGNLVDLQTLVNEFNSMDIKLGLIAWNGVNELKDIMFSNSKNSETDQQSLYPDPGAHKLLPIIKQAAIILPGLDATLKKNISQAMLTNKTRQQQPPQPNVKVQHNPITIAPSIPPSIAPSMALPINMNPQSPTPPSTPSFPGSMAQPIPVPQSPIHPQSMNVSHPPMTPPLNASINASINQPINPLAMGVSPMNMANLPTAMNGGQMPSVMNCSPLSPHGINMNTPMNNPMNNPINVMANPMNVMGNPANLNNQLNIPMNQPQSIGQMNNPNNPMPNTAVNTVPINPTTMLQNNSNIANNKKVIWEGTLQWQTEIFEGLKIREHKNTKKDQFFPSNLSVEVYPTEPDWKTQLASIIHQGAPTVEVDRAHSKHEKLKEKVLECQTGIPFCRADPVTIFILAHNKGSIYGVVTNSEFLSKPKQPNISALAYQKPLHNTIPKPVQYPMHSFPNLIQGTYPQMPFTGQPQHVGIPSQTHNVTVSAMPGMKNQGMPPTQAMPIPMANQSMIPNTQGNKPPQGVANPSNMPLQSNAINPMRIAAQPRMPYSAASIISTPLLSTNRYQNPQQMVEQPMAALQQQHFASNPGH